MNIFDIHEQVIDEYSRYVQSFLRVADQRVEGFIQEQLIVRRNLWPHSLIQLNPAYEKTQTITELVNPGVLHPQCADIFRNTRGEPLHLYRHQQEAIARAKQEQPYIVTSGTGSGKTMAYFVPIFDAILRVNATEPKVWAIIVYPMNALVNSQKKALDNLAEQYQRRTGRPMPVRFAKYTGQESNDDKRRYQQNPPHILLTNYVMLELMLVRPREARFVDQATTALQYLVLDELHTYRGRQGADVALLVRRLKEKSGNPNLLCIGTSATMATGNSRDERRTAVADFATKLFGAPVRPENVIEETLRRVVPRPTPPAAAELRQALSGPLPHDWQTFQANPLSSWIEDTFGLREENGHLRRQLPITLEKGAKALAEQTGVDEATCAGRLQEMLLAGSQILTPSGDMAFAFKLHQFISQGGSVYATLEQSGKRLLTLNGQYYAPGEGERILYPLVFCRICGQEYYTARRSGNGRAILPDTMAMVADALDEEEAEAGQAGYLMLDPDGRWPDETEALPEHWLDDRGRLRSEYKPFRPLRQLVRPDGELVDRPGDDAIAAWFIPKPFMLCLNCGEAYTRRDKNDFRKLARLSSEGRSTATTLLSLATVAAMRQTDLEPAAQKLLSFTDNRQDASLQAGHFNDFVQVALLRSALYQALSQQGELHFQNIAQAVIEALDVELDGVARQTGLDPHSRQGIETRNSFHDVVEYRLYEDLRRGWRVVQPNMEQCGLLELSYKGLDELIQREDMWQGIPFLSGFTPAVRLEIISTLLDEMRRQLTIDVDCLKENKQQELKRRAADYLNKNWAFDELERLRYASVFVRPGVERAPGDFSLSTRSVFGRWLKGYLRHQAAVDLDTDTYERVVNGILDALARFGLLIEQNEERGRRQGLRLRASALIWRPGSGTPPVSLLRRYRGRGEQYQPVGQQTNAYFQTFYSAPRTLVGLRNMKGAEHTAQIAPAARIEREDLFREGKLPALFCSPTMELGVDIADLNAVHLRNVPPTPANYAQRSGRSGRAGQPAVVLAYCAYGSGHDQYYFRQRQKMVAGAVTPPRIELSNEDLVRAHIHAIWLAAAGIKMEQSILEIVDIDQDSYPLLGEVKTQSELNAARRTACLAACRRVLASCGLEGEQASWFTDSWLEEQIINAPKAFDHAFDRWRELFRIAWTQFLQAQQIKQRAMLRRGRDAQEEAQRATALEREAQRQLDLLRCENISHEESDFYPYRYLAGEGFLPGYNFPALPVRAYISSGRSGEYIARPRFLALNEFGPHNVIYHDGAKYQVDKAMLPVEEPEKRFRRAKLCEHCGYLHEGEVAHLDLCLHCGTRLTATNSDYLESLLEMPTAGTLRRERITCDEEERLRRGFDLTSHFKFSLVQNRPVKRLATVRATAGGEAMLQLVYAPSAVLWRINHRWRQAEHKGYRLEMKQGRWLQQMEIAAAPDGRPATEVRPNVRLFVQDNANALLIYPPADKVGDESFLATLQYALARGIQEKYQVEEGELASERIGAEEQRAILMWEAAEGGLGVLRHLVATPPALADVAQRALVLLHYDLETGEDLRPGSDSDDGCAKACYDCLLSYYNQRDHWQLNRLLLRDFLWELAGAVTEVGSTERDFDEHYRYLRGQTDAASNVERVFLDHLYQTRRRLPDAAQQQLADAYSQPDFFYEPNVCVFCDGRVHDEPQQQANDEQVRQSLRHQGYRIIVIRFDRDMEEQVAAFADVFGENRGRDA